MRVKVDNKTALGAMRQRDDFDNDFAGNKSNVAPST